MSINSTVYFTKVFKFFYAYGIFFLHHFDLRKKLVWIPTFNNVLRILLNFI